MTSDLVSSTMSAEDGACRSSEKSRSKSPTKEMSSRSISPKRTKRRSKSPKGRSSLEQYPTKQRSSRSISPKDKKRRSKSSKERSSRSISPKPRSSEEKSRSKSPTRERSSRSISPNGNKRSSKTSKERSSRSKSPKPRSSQSKSAKERSKSPKRKSGNSDKEKKSRKSSSSKSKQPKDDKKSVLKKKRSRPKKAQSLTLKKTTESVTCFNPQQQQQQQQQLPLESPSPPPQKARSLPRDTSDSQQTTKKKVVDLTPLISRETRLSAALDAALTGQYTRLKEHVVESVSVFKDEQDTTHFRKSGHLVNTTRSSMFRVITEAAALGSMKTSKHIEIVTNDSSLKQDAFDADGDDDDEICFERQLASSASFSNSKRNSTIAITTNDDPTKLVNKYVKFHQVRKREQLLDAEHALEKMEQSNELDKKLKSLELELPTSAVPKFRKSVSYMTDGRLRAVVIQEAAEKAHTRQARLVFDGKFIAHQTCRCIYCYHPSAFQTQAYAKLRMKQNWGDDSLLAEQQSQRNLNVQLDDDGDTEMSGTNTSKSRRSTGFSTSIPKRKTLATLITDTAGQSKLETDPNLPSHFQETATSKQQVRAWKSRAAQAKRESYEKMQEGSGGVHDPAPPPPPVGAKGWDDTFITPRTARKIRQDQSLSMSMHDRKSKPAWSMTKLKKTNPAKDPKQRQQELNDNQKPVWSSGKDMLSPTKRINSRVQSKGGSLSMSEHSPFRQSFSSPSSLLSPNGGKRLNHSKSLDLEIDEEELLLQTLNSSSEQQQQRQRFAVEAKSSSGEGSSYATSFGGSIDETGESETDDEDDDGFGF